MKIDVLDHGYVQLVDSFGEDSSIIEAARMSTNKGFLGWGDAAHDKRCPNVFEDLKKKCEDCGNAPGDEKLLKFLYENRHSTPFEFAGLVIEVQAPIFVFREWHRHRTQSYNEMSARYTPLPDFNYMPTTERLFMTQSHNTQAKAVEGAEELAQAQVDCWHNNLVEFYESAERLYQYGLKIGLPKEIARICLPVGRYSRMRASANLRNWLGFLTLRTAPNAQWEIRQYANAVGEIVAEKFPRTWELFNKEMKK